MRTFDFCEKTEEAMRALLMIRDYKGMFLSQIHVGLARLLIFCLKGNLPPRITLEWLIANKETREIRQVPFSPAEIQKWFQLAKKENNLEYSKLKFVESIR